MNRAYQIRRHALLDVLNLPTRIPVGQTGEWTDVEVPLGYVPFHHHQYEHWLRTAPRVVLPKVRLLPRGVANRLQVLCPCCRATWVRFSVLHQHAGSEACRVAGLKQSKQQTVYDRLPKTAVVPAEALIRTVPV